jgi:hypothetical protein
MATKGEKIREYKLYINRLIKVLESKPTRQVKKSVIKEIGRVKDKIKELQK